MCLEQVGRIRHVDARGGQVVIDTAEGARRASLALLTLEDSTVHPGEWVMVHTGLVVRRIDEDTARSLLAEREALRSEEDSA